MSYRNDFGENFSWGVSTSAYQIEGGYCADGKGRSIWDAFSQTKGKISGNENGNIACDFYYRYRDDLGLMRRLHIPDYRFSVSWSRILPQGTGALNQCGIDYYDRVIDCCLELGITPWITLYHWDLPHELERKGGWTNRDIIHWFGEYVSCCILNFGDRVKNWMVLNEPVVFTGAGYFLGVHAPGRKGISPFLAAVHHAAMCQAEGGRIIRSLGKHCRIGTTFSASQITPFNETKDKDLVAARKVDALVNRIFIEPLLGLSYPTKDLKVLRRIERFVKQGDESKLAFDMDFVGVQNYTREIVRHSLFTPYIHAAVIPPQKRNVCATIMGWEIYPESIYHVLKKFAGYPNIPELIITENGAAFPDKVEEGTINDEKRVAYLKSYLQQVLRARNEGVNIKGYFIWTLLDNFEWARGYAPRFGLVHVDFKTQQRIVKSSGYWYGRFLQGIATIKEDC